VEILVGLARCLYFLGRFRQILELLLDHRNRLEGLDDPSLTGPLNFWIGYTHGLLGDQDRARQGLQRALADATRCGDPVAAGRAHCGLAREAFWTGELQEGIEHGGRAVSLLEPTTDRWWLGHAYWVLGTDYSFSGELQAALEAQGRAHAVGVAIGDSRLQSFAAWSTSGILTLMGDYPAAIEASRRSLDSSPDPINTVLAVAYLGRAYAEAGDVASAVPLLERAVREVAELRMERSQGRITTWLAEAYCLRGDLEKARVTAMRALESTEAGGHRYGSAEAHRALGRIDEAAGLFPEAAARLDQALEGFGLIGARLEVGRTHLAHAGLARRRGLGAEAAAHLDQARRLFADLGVSRYVERVDAEVRALAGRTTRGSRRLRAGGPRGTRPRLRDRRATRDRR
jgi:tetratricopeptide (TPR) repeat protein